MTTLNYTVRFKKTVLASLVGFCSSQFSFAFEELSDASLSNTTGEGIAILPQNTYMVFRGAGPNETITQILTDRSKDTGYINYMPVGPLSLAAADTSGNGTIGAEDHAVGKADLFLYGLALSKSDGNANTRIATSESAATISSWGTVANPWVLKAQTNNNVPNFNKSDNSVYPVTYLSLEAPLYQPDIDGTEGSDAYNLKLGVWADAFVRNPNVSSTITDGSQFQYGSTNGMIGTIDPSRANRLRLQGVINGFSVNGSQLSFFQTLNGATATDGMSPFYNNTLGMSGLIRLNTGNSQNTSIITENVTNSSQTYANGGTNDGWQVVHAGANSTLSTSTTGDCNNTSSTSALGVGAGCRYYVEKRTRTDSITSNKTRSNFNDTSKVLRLSTRETSDSPNRANNLYTPALDSTNPIAPNFSDNEGLYLYYPNINLVLGNLYQPVILGSDGKNFSIELTRVANKPAIYRKIYTDYFNTNSGYEGSTCNVYQCSNATHSSISIGTAYSPDGGLTLLADKSEGAVGVSFGRVISTATQVSGATAGSMVNLANTVSGTRSTTMTEVRYKQRQQNVESWRQKYSCGALWGSCTATPGYLYQWEYNQGSGNWVIIDPRVKPNDAATCSGGIAGCTNTSGTTPMYGTIANRNWANSSAWLTAKNVTLDGFIGAGNGTTGYVMPSTNQAPALANIGPLNNLGSAVIDGLLIQHLKLTTKGL